VRMPATIWAMICDDLDEIQSESIEKVERSVRKAEIKAAIKAGMEIPGSDLTMGALRLDLR
ncbi:MAG: hypothetical protein ACREB3_17765, partial [Burkholderiales bacterium]